MNIAMAAAMRSEDPYCKVGATVLSEDGSVFGVGYNGTKAGVTVDYNDRDARRPFMVHAESNALRHVTPYLVEGGVMAVTHFPCADCVRLAGIYDIKEVVWLYEPEWSRYRADASYEVAQKFGVSLSSIRA